MPVLVVDEAPVCVSVTGQVNRERMWDVISGMLFSYTKK